MIFDNNTRLPRTSVLGAASRRWPSIKPWRGPLVSSPLAKEIREIRKSDSGGVWASDPFWGDALVMAQGVHMLSGQQPLGPNREAWDLLDPTHQFEDKWNRGQSYVHFTWDINRLDILISNPNPDIMNCRSRPSAKCLIA